MKLQEFINSFGKSVTLEVDSKSVKNSTGYKPGSIFKDYNGKRLVLVGVKGQKFAKVAYFRDESGSTVFSCGVLNLRLNDQVLTLVQSGQ